MMRCFITKNPTIMRFASLFSHCLLDYINLVKIIARRGARFSIGLE